MRDGRMHQTTVRFGPDLWDALEIECSRLGVSAAQYLREAAVARLSYTSGRRGEEGYGNALVDAGARPSDVGPERSAVATLERVGVLQGIAAGAAQRDSAGQVDAAAAVSAQTELVRKRAREVRSRSQDLRRMRADSEPPR
jgi:hypothetical protein